MGEGAVHVAARRFLRHAGWQLVAGQYPGGSDDEVFPLNIMDPLLACDYSPDHRRHSLNKLAPDLVACKQDRMLIIEMKPAYSPEDETKLVDLLASRRDHLVSALQDLVDTRGVVLPVPPHEFVFVPCLAFGASSRYYRRMDFCYLLVSALDVVAFAGNALIPAI